MNPYLEQADVWPDFHNTFLVAMREELVRQLQPRYFVRVEEHIYVQEYDSEDRRPLGRPDVSILPTRNPRNSGGGVAIDEPRTGIEPVAVMIPPGADEIRSAFLEIRDREDRHVVTAIELLSPANKYAGADRDVYWNKVRRILGSRTHFVEIDLLRGGPRMPWLDLPACSYYALVSRADERPRAEVWAVGLRDQLPQVAIPVKSGDREAQIDLQLLLRRVYDSAGYHDSIYDGHPEPRLAVDDEKWAEQVLAANPV